MEGEFLGLCANEQLLRTRYVHLEQPVLLLHSLIPALFWPRLAGKSIMPTWHATPPRPGT